MNWKFWQKAKAAEVPIFLDHTGTFPIPMMGVKVMLERLKEPDVGGYNIVFVEAWEVYSLVDPKPAALQFKYCPTLGSVLMHSALCVDEISIITNMDVFVEMVNYRLSTLGF